MKRFFALFAVLFILHTIVSSQPIYMTVEGSLQGKFRGESAREKGDKMDVFAMSMEVLVGRDAGSGIASGRRQHQPFFVRKSSGAASPQFFQATVTNELIRRVVIEFRGNSTNGEEAAFYLITLENVRIVGFKQAAEIADTRVSAANILFDEIKFSYQKITVESNTGKTMATDNASAER